jgi:hypothetical protein
MPFRIAEAAVHTGNIGDGESVVVLTTAGKRVVGAKWYDSKNKRLMLVSRHWPAAVRRAAAEVVETLAARGRPVNPSTVTAWVRTPQFLMAGHTGWVIDVKSDLRHRTVTVELKGTITGFEIPEER